MLNFAEHAELFSSLSNDIVESEEFGIQRPLLAHYTSLDTIEKILKYKQVWLSNPLFMNDFEEFRFGMNEGLALVESEAIFNEFPSMGSISKKIVEHYNGLYNSYADNLAMDVYILCLCKHDEDDNDGKLSMWRGYGAVGNGACIVFDTSKTEPVDGTPFILGKVHYATREARLERLKSYVRQFCVILQDQDLEHMNLLQCVYILFERIKLFALFTKHHGFSEEAEWRLVYFSELDTVGEYKDMIDYHLGKFGLEPKLKLDLSKIPGTVHPNGFLDQCTTKIIIGPSLSSPHSQNLLKRMVVKCGHEYLVDRISTSQIPFRNRQMIM